MTTNSNSILLEPDSSLLDQHLMFSNPEGSIEDLLLQAPREEGEKPWTIIKPLPGFCVKLRKANSEREKVFINICKTDKIPTPEEISEQELMKILNSDEPSIYRVPMSIGEEREDVDKSGNPCAVYDIVVNSTFYRKVETSQIFRRFLLAATLEALEDKYGLTLEKEEFVVLKGRKCKGGMTEHRIQVRSKPMVEVLPGGISSQISDKKLINKSGTVAKKKPLITEVESTYIDSKQNKETLYSTKEPQYIIQWMNPEENGRNVIFAKFFLTGMLFAKDIELDVGEDRILLQTKKKEYFIDIFLPHLINQEKTIAKFSGHTKVLMLIMPLAG